MAQSLKPGKIVIRSKLSDLHCKCLLQMASKTQSNSTGIAKDSEKPKVDPKYAKNEIQMHTVSAVIERQRSIYF